MSNTVKQALLERNKYCKQIDEFVIRNHRLHMYVVNLQVNIAWKTNYM